MTQPTTTYSKQQLIDALVNEYEQLCYDSTLEEGEFTPSEYLTYLNSLTHHELVYETGTDEDTFPLSQFMSTYS